MAFRRRNGATFGEWVVLSWSGDRSRQLAQAIHAWLKPVVQAAEPWMSDRDIGAGQRWSTELAAILAKCIFGVICLTPENTNALWLYFEAGALAKALDCGRVVPVLFGLTARDLPPPLSQFQAVEATRDGMFALVRAVNSSLGRARVGDEVVGQTFNAMWPSLSARLAAIPVP